MSKSTYVQTELSAEEYHHFQSLADERGLSLTAALREAAEVWMEHQQQVDPDDPLFEILDQLNQEPVPTPRTNASTEDDIIGDWSGETAGIRFGETAGREE